MLKFFKKPAGILGIAVGLGIALAVPLPSYASNLESVVKLSLLAAKFRNMTGGYCRTSVSGKYLSQGRAYTVKTTLYRGYSYTIFGAGDSSVNDLDIIIYDENWNRIKRDTKSDAIPVVASRPKWTGTFYIRAKMYSGSGYSNVMICHR
ncbi:MAG: hypothetical protein GY862_32895 [Gammaproteobacteria bacterium]|nr:hypothetical protein [Gammaproteobacteria bacterium]